MKKSFVLVLFVISLGPMSFSQCTNSQGPDSAATIVNDPSIGSQAWLGTAGVCCSNNNYALFTSAGTGTISNYLKATGFGFSIPAAAVVCGIEVRVERSRNASEAQDYEVRLVKSNVISGSNLALPVTWPFLADSVVVYGNDTSLWGSTWTAADINASGFGAAVSTIQTGAGSSIPRVDQITVQV